ncbi:MAG: hypothetical protein LBF61_02270 [Azoarcus sp.]|jgi:type VI protein secretion system component VasA|nr:hypothetical protein [Azoarcus sp.]
MTEKEKGRSPFQEAAPDTAQSDEDHTASDALRGWLSLARNSDAAHAARRIFSIHHRHHKNSDAAHAARRRAKFRKGGHGRRA